LNSFDEAGRKAALAKVLPLQRRDFVGIIKAMQGKPCTIRLLDPPLHEFVPHEPEQQAELAAKLGVPAAHVAKRVKDLHESNPMLGHRGCRLGISYPEIYNMQVRAIMEATIEVARTTGNAPAPEIMIPLIGKKSELAFSKKHAVVTAETVLKENNATGKISYSVGTMIEVPRAAVTADEIAQEAEFFSFGTNDLTQMGCGFSRDDSGPFLRKYMELGIYDRDPFETIDENGVGQLVQIAVRKGRSVNPTLKCGICGEHGGDPVSIAFFHKVGLNYVSCSPFRVPVAIVAAARAAIEEERKIAAERQRLLNSKI
jgi:pyruvate, orthophosphate dikinase